MEKSFVVVLEEDLEQDEIYDLKRAFEQFKGVKLVRAGDLAAARAELIERIQAAMRGDEVERAKWAVPR